MIATYPDSTDWVGKGWHTEPTKTTMKRYKDSDGTVFFYHDINGGVHALWTWKDGGISFRWGLHPSAIEHYTVEYTGPVDPPLQKLADAWREYLDAVVERETR